MICFKENFESWWVPFELTLSSFEGLHAVSALAAAVVDGIVEVLHVLRDSASGLRSSVVLTMLLYSTTHSLR